MLYNAAKYCDSTPSSISMTVIRLFDAQPDMHIFGNVHSSAELPFAPPPPKAVKAENRPPRYFSISHLYQLHYIVSHNSPFVNMFICFFQKIYVRIHKIFCTFLLLTIDNLYFLWYNYNLEIYNNWRLKCSKVTFITTSPRSLSRRLP